MSAILLKPKTQNLVSPTLMELKSFDDNSFADYLPWYDIIFKHILPGLDLKSLLCLHAVNSSYKALVEEYHKYAQSFNMNDAHVTPKQFVAVTSQMTSLHAVALGPCRWLTNQMVAPLIARNPHLIWISLRECTSLTNAIVLKIAVCCPNLRGLNLTDCHWLTGDTVKFLLQRCPQMQSLDLTRCSLIDDNAIALVVRRAKSLASLCIAGAVSVTDRGMAHVSLLPHLNHLNVQYTNITDSSLRLIARNMKQLKHIDLFGCRKVTKSAIARLSARQIELDVRNRPRP